MQANRRYLFFSMTGILATLLLSAAINLSSGDRLSGTASEKIISDQLTGNAHASPPRQSSEEIIRATLEEAAASLGGGFVWEGTGYFAMVRPPKIVGYRLDQDKTPVHLFEEIIIYSDYDNSSCQFPYTFHGMNGCLLNNEGMPNWGIVWQPQAGVKIDGHFVTLDANSYLDYGCLGGTSVCGNYGQDSITPFPLAEALHQAALNNGLYEAVPEDESTLIDPGAIIPGQPEVSTDQNFPIESSETRNIPWPIILASLGIPVTGALAGSIVSAILASRSVDEMAKAGEEFVSQVGDQVQLEADGNAKLSAQQLQALDSDLQAINVELTNRKIYVLNPYQGDPTVVGHKILTGLNVVLNNTAGRWTGQRGLSCEDYVNETQEKIVEIVSKRFPGAKVENMIFEENSTVRDQKSWGDWFDSFVDDNHNLTRVTLPDGSEWAVDFHQKNAGKAPLMRSWSEARAEWKEYLGKDEFKERSRRTLQTEPKPPK